jgi:hypothetical protein
MNWALLSITSLYCACYSWCDATKKETARRVTGGLKSRVSPHNSPTPANSNLVRWFKGGRK